MSVDSWSGYKFLGPRGQEKHILDLADQTIDIPCGKCDLCRIERRYCRALRIMLEAESWPGKSYFITLTFNDSHVGSNELDHLEWSQFVKNFRQKFCQSKYCNIRDRGTLREGKEYSHTFKKIKQVMAGEYGDTFGRKHFHGILFNHVFSDMYFTGNYSKKGNEVWSSRSLEEVWGKGHVQVEEISFDLALYVGSYITDDALEDSGHKKKQYGRFGRGIGKSWIEKYWKDVLSAGKVMLRDRSFPIPRMFRVWMRDQICPTQYDRFYKQKMLRLKETKKKNIEKGDGPLRRARAKGRIFEHIHSKRRLDGQFKQVT